MLKNKSRLAVILFFILCSGFSSYARAGNLVPLDLAKKVAADHTSRAWGKVALKEPVLYYHVDGTPAVYVFTIYKGKGIPPSDTAILNKTKYCYNLLSKAKPGQEGFFWKKIRGEEEFATLVVGASTAHMPILMYYDGLPLHYLSLESAKQKAVEALNTASVKLNRYIWEDFYAVFFEFSDNQGHLIMVNAYSNEILSQPDSIQAKLALQNFKKSDAYLKKLERCKQAWEQVSKPNAATQSQPTITRLITGVPDYQQKDFPVHGICAPISAACVLAYWDDHVSRQHKYVFERLVDGGDSDWNTNPNGVSALVEELKSAMSWDPVNGVYLENISPGINAACNDSAYGNNYTFQTDTNPQPPLEEEPVPPPPVFDFVKTEIDAMHPALFAISSTKNNSYKKHVAAVVGYKIEQGANYIIIHDNLNAGDVFLIYGEITEGYLTRINPGTQEPSNINCAQAAIAHHYTYCTEEDVISSEPLLTQEIWKWWVSNLVDTGEAISHVKFTANCPPPVVWWKQLPPSYENPPTYIWDYGVSIPEDEFYNVGGNVEPGAQILSPVWISRQVVPEILEEPETIQTVTAQVIFTSLPLQDANVWIGIPREVLDTPLIQTEIISQNDLPDWTESIEGGQAGWHIPHDKINLNVPYTFIAEVRSLKSPQIIETPVLWKPKVSIGMSNWVFITPPAVGNSCELFHPEDGVTVTFETADNTGWIACLDAGGIELAIERVLQIAPSLDPIGDKTVNEGETLSFNINATDLDYDTLTYSASNLPQGASFDPGSHTFTWTPDFTQAGTYTNIHFEVSDGKWSDSEDITITVNNVNRPPVLNPIGNQSINEGALLQFNVSANDPDGETIAYSMIGAPQGATIDPQTGLFSWRPTYTQAGNYTVTFVASDGNLSDSEIITITVNNIICPDLSTGAIIYSPLNPRAGKVVTFKVPISNIGSATTGKFTIAFEVDGTRKRLITQKKLKPAQTITATFKWKAQRGTHNIRIIADANNQIAEQNETDNIAETQVVVR